MSMSLAVRTHMSCFLYGLISSHVSPQLPVWQETGAPCFRSCISFVFNVFFLATYAANKIYTWSSHTQLLSLIFKFALHRNEVVLVSSELRMHMTVSRK